MEHTSTEQPAAQTLRAEFEAFELLNGDPGDEAKEILQLMIGAVVDAFQAGRTAADFSAEGAVNPDAKLSTDKACEAKAKLRALLSKNSARIAQLEAAQAQRAPLSDALAADQAKQGGA